MRWPWRPWRRREVEEPGNGHAAAKRAKEQAEAALKAAEARWPEVHHARNVFAEEVERAWRRRRQA